MKRIATMSGRHFRDLQIVVLSLFVIVGGALALSFIGEASTFHQLLAITVWAVMAGIACVTLAFATRDLFQADGPMPEALTNLTLGNQVVERFPLSEIDKAVFFELNRVVGNGYFKVKS